MLSIRASIITSAELHQRHGEALLADLLHASPKDLNSYEIATGGNRPQCS